MDHEIEEFCLFKSELIPCQVKINNIYLFFYSIPNKSLLFFLGSPS